jgi:hypothetical protein
MMVTPFLGASLPADRGKRRERRVCARCFYVIVLLLAFAASAEGPLSLPRPVPNAFAQDLQAEGEPRHRGHLTLVSYFSGEAPALLSEDQLADATDRTT